MGNARKIWTDSNCTLLHLPIHKYFEIYQKLGVNAASSYNNVGVVHLNIFLVHLMKLLDVIHRKYQIRLYKICNINNTFLFFSRCCEKKSCGNRNETPSDPVVCDR